MAHFISSWDPSPPKINFSLFCVNNKLRYVRCMCIYIQLPLWCNFYLVERMLHNSFTQITTQSAFSFPVVPRRHADQLPPLVRSCDRLSQRRPLTARSTAVAVSNSTLTGGGKGYLILLLLDWLFFFNLNVKYYRICHKILLTGWVGFSN